MLIAALSLGSTSTISGALDRRRGSSRWRSASLWLKGRYPVLVAAFANLWYFMACAIQ